MFSSWQLRVVGKVSKLNEPKPGEGSEQGDWSHVFDAQQDEQSKGSRRQKGWQPPPFASVL